MDSKQNLGFDLNEENNSQEFSDPSNLYELGEEEPYSFIGIPFPLLSFVIAIGVITIPIYAVLIQHRSFSTKENAQLPLEPHGSKKSFSLSFSRVSQHSC